MQLSRRVGSLAGIVAICFVGSECLAQTSSTPANSALQMQSAPPPSTISNAGPGPQAIPEDFERVLLASGFLVNVRVFDEPDMSGPLRVDANGDVAMSLIGKVHAAGLTASQLADALSEKFKALDVLKNPNVSVDIVEYVSGYVSVVGEVNRPGRIPLLAPHSLQEVLSAAGGETPLASDTIDIRARADERPLRTLTYKRSMTDDQIKNTMVYPTDTVIVHRAGVVYVLGAVTRPGGYVMQEDGHLTAMQALALAQGLMLEAKVKSARVIRRLPDGKTLVFPVEYRKVTKGKAEGDPLLQPEDIVYVDISGAKEILSGSKGILSSIGAAAIYTQR